MNRDDVERTVDKGIKSMQGMFVDVACNLSQLLVDEEMANQNPLHPKNGLIERTRQEIAQELLTRQEQLKKGARVLFTEGQTEELNKLVALAENMSANREAFIEALGEGKSIQEIAGISDDALEQLYQTAKRLYEAKNFEDAADAFRFLCTLNSQKFAFWLGLGNCEFGLKHFDEALFAYAFVSEVNPEDFFCHLFSSRCYEELGDKDNAINALELALFVLGANSEHKDIEERIHTQIKHLRGEE